MSMSRTYRFWTHGVNVVPEWTKEYTGDDNGLYMRRAGFGADIRQNAGTGNWFHFAVPSATQLHDENVEHFHAYLRGKINNYARLTAVHIHQTITGGETERIYATPEEYNVTGQIIEEDFNLEDKRVRGPIVICVGVEFEQGGVGEVRFTGAGIRFEMFY